jgi:hypothetical protein
MRLGRLALAKIATWLPCPTASAAADARTLGIVTMRAMAKQKASFW